MGRVRISGMKLVNTLALCLVSLVIFFGCSSASSSTAADPLTGTWKGEWGPSSDRQTDVTVEFKWDGTVLHGTVNPGGSAYEFTKASFDPKAGDVKMELDGPNSRREVVHYLIEGKISGKTLSGRFDRAGEKGTFRIEKK